MGQKPSPLGGWLIGSSQRLANGLGVDLFVASPNGKVGTYSKHPAGKITYYTFQPVRDSNVRSKKSLAIFKEMIREVDPNIVHLHGTEMPHALTAVHACRELGIPVVISIQGLVSKLATHINANLPLRVIYCSTPRNALRRDSVVGLRRLYQKRGRHEVEAVRSARNVIGRTTWDRACISQMDDTVSYYFCNETLRESFYEGNWQIDSCDRHSIFMSQAQYPLKGIHYLLEAMPLIIEKYPDARLYVGGKDLTEMKTLKQALSATCYGHYVRRLIKKKQLEGHVVFTGSLSESEIRSRYLRSHVFVCSSSIENSPNSLGEAMILGVPCVASGVGGIPDMLRHDVEGFIYQHDAPYMLAHYICTVFADDNLASRFSTNAQNHARMTHDPNINTSALVKIYADVASAS